MVLSPLLASAGMVGISSTAEAAVTTGAITVFPDRDMVEAADYPAGAALTIEVWRAGARVGVTQGTGPAIEVNHGPEGTAQPGDCWNGPVPNIVGGDEIRVFNASRTINDSMTVAGVAFAGAPTEVSGTVRMKVTGADRAAADVAFRSVDPFFRPERQDNGSFFSTTSDATSVTHIFTPQTTYQSDVAGPLTFRQQLDAALDSPWRATVDRTGLEREVTLAESDGVNGPAAGCPTVAQQLPGAPTMQPAVAGDGQATVSWTAPADTGTTPITSYEIEVDTNATAPRTVTVLDETQRSFVVGGLTNGTTYTFRVRALNASGEGPYSGPSVATPRGGTVVERVPGAPTIGQAGAGNAQATVRWAPPSDLGSPALESYQIQVREGTTQVGPLISAAAGATSTTVSGLDNGTAYNFRVRAVNSVGASIYSAPSNIVTPTGGVTVTVPSRPAAPRATAGTVGGTITASATWTAPNNGGATITGYILRALRMSSTGTVLGTTRFNLSGTTLTRTVTLPQTGNYRFSVQAQNSAGVSQISLRSNLVAGR